MQYRTDPKNGRRLSALAFGCMRLPKDESEARKLVVHAIEQGVNVFDTAYVYPGNEVLVGRILASDPALRDKIALATKMPPYLVRKPEDLTKILETQLQRLQTDRIDYYFMHMLMSVKEWDQLCRQGVEDWIQAEKKRGRIGQAGFSSHAPADTYIQLCDAYPWDFTMIQYNYADRHNQAGQKGLAHAAGLGLPVFIMEPLRGGALAGRLPPKARDFLTDHPAGWTPAEWSLRWLWHHGEITTVLSGMNSMAVLEENLKIAETALPGQLTAEELAAADRAEVLLREALRVNCTGCRYCLPCPQGVNIPVCFEQWNQMHSPAALREKMVYVIRTHQHYAGLCTGCGKCERHCPQGLPIRQLLKRVKREAESGLGRPLRFIIPRVMKL